jgi:hypothetical protein
MRIATVTEEDVTVLLNIVPAAAVTAFHKMSKILFSVMPATPVALASAPAQYSIPRIKRL